MSKNGGRKENGETLCSEGGLTEPVRSSWDQQRQIQRFAMESIVNVVGRIPRVLASMYLQYVYVKIR